MLKYRYVSLLFLIALALISYILDFNGLYGQDAHEYLRQSRVFFARMQALPVPPASIGEAELAGGYPLAGALFQFLGFDAGLGLQVLSWLAAAAALWLFVSILGVLSPGTHAKSHWVLALLGLALAPFFLRAGLTVMSDALGLALALAALFFVLRALELQRHSDAVGFAVFAVLACTTRYAYVVLLALPALALILELWREQKWAWLVAGFAAAVCSLAPFFWLKSGAPGNLLGHSLMQDWSFFNLFKRTFVQASGTVSYSLPNFIYLFFPFVHPGFCLLLPALFLLAKRTDVRLYSKRILVLSLFLYLLFLGGVPHQNLRYLLPAYTVLLLLLFPAWDRFYAYGLYFFRRLVYTLIALVVACQLFFSSSLIQPTLARNHFEQELAEALKLDLRQNDIVYGFDVDIALRSYFPAVEFRNLWVEQFKVYPAGSYFLFNAPKLRAQWSGQPPILNWEYVQAHYLLQEVRFLPEGWTLYRVIEKE